MLVLTRKIGEEILVDGEIRISVVRIRGNRVQIGVAAPPSVRIQRRELTSAPKERRPVGVALSCGRSF